jgi:predicted SnoaL-like aldol condensation-catalyzing enzyme
MTAAVPTTEWIVDRLRAADFEGLGARYAPGVLLDVNVPKWRMQLQGRAAASEFLGEEVGKLPNVRTTWLRSTTTADTIVVEYELRWDGPDGELLSRAASVLRLDGDTIIEHTDYCCGEYTVEDLAKIDAEAPIIRW